MFSTEMIWTLVSFILTLLIFSYIFGDNPLFRLATYLFVGVSAGYVTVLIIYQVILPRIIYPLLSGDLYQMLLLGVVPLVLSVMLLAKLSPKLSFLGNIPMAYLVGSGAAVAIGGALLGTLFSQIGASFNMFNVAMLNEAGENVPFSLLEGVIVLAGTVLTLVYFQFGARAKPGQTPTRNPLVEGGAKIGQIFIAVTLGALFAGVFSASLTALIERLSYVWGFLSNFIG